MKASKGVVAGFWVFTVLFAWQIAFTCYAQLKLPQVAAEFVRMGYPAYFRVELAWAKLAGVIALLVPIVPARLKEWAYAGFAFTLASAVIAHKAIGEGANAWGWAAGTAVLGALSYFFWRKMEAARVDVSAIS
jgi:hypothetical protein